MLAFPDMAEPDSSPVRVTMPVTKCVTPVVDRLKEALVGHPGTNEVQLHLTNGSRTTVLRLEDRLRVSPSPELFAELKALLGPGVLG